MDNFDPYNVLLSIATNISVTYDCFCAAETHIRSLIQVCRDSWENADVLFSRSLLKT